MGYIYYILIIGIRIPHPKGASLNKQLMGSHGVGESHDTGEGVQMGHAL